MYASMRNTETCAIMPRLILEMRGIARIAGTAGGVNRTHKRTLAGAKSRHIVSLLCRKNPVFFSQKALYYLAFALKKLMYFEHRFFDSFLHKKSMFFTSYYSCVIVKNCVKRTAEEVSLGNVVIPDSFYR